MVPYPGGQIGFLIAAILTHGLVGYTLGTVVFSRPVAGTVAALAPDVDLLFPASLGSPFVHRGVTHSLLAAAIAVAVASRNGRTVAGAVAVGYASHLLIDVTTPAGVPLAAPLSMRHVEFGLRGHAFVPTLAIWACCLLVLAFRRERAALAGS